MPSIYILLTKTNSVLSRVIATHTKEDYVHASIIMSRHLEHGYSFSRKKLRNPLIGGFVKEEYAQWIDYFKEVQCCIYELEVTDNQYQDINRMIGAFEADKEKYKYHFLGLMAQSLRIDYERENRFFCTQFVAHVLTETGALDLGKHPIHVRSDDFRKHKDLHLIYEGKLKDVLYKVIEDIPNLTQSIKQAVG